MDELKELYANGLLISEKQYKRYIATYIIASIFFIMVFIGGLFLAMFSKDSYFIILGVVMLLIGIVLLISLVFIFILKYGAKLQFYRYFKKHPEEFMSSDQLE